MELALEGIEKVAHIATTLASTLAATPAHRKQCISCGRLGAELLVVARYLDSVGGEEDGDALQKVPKLLRFVERLCCVSNLVKMESQIRVIRM